MGTAEFRSLLDLKVTRSDAVLVRWATDAEVFILFTEVMACKPEVILECGTANGWTAAWMSMALKELQSDALIHTFDITLREHIRPLDNVRYYLEPFHIGGSRVAKEYADTHKLIFIDGNHKRVAVQQDFDSVSPFLKLGDVIIFHDTIREPGLCRFIHDFDRTLDCGRTVRYATRNGITVYTI